MPPNESLNAIFYIRAQVSVFLIGASLKIVNVLFGSIITVFKSTKEYHFVVIYDNCSYFLFLKIVIKNHF